MFDEFGEAGLLGGGEPLGNLLLEEGLDLDVVALGFALEGEHVEGGLLGAGAAGGTFGEELLDFDLLFHAEGGFLLEIDFLGVLGVEGFGEFLLAGGEHDTLGIGAGGVEEAGGEEGGGVADLLAEDLFAFEGFEGGELGFVEGFDFRAAGGLSFVDFALDGLAGLHDGVADAELLGDGGAAGEAVFGGGGFGLFGREELAFEDRELIGGGEGFELELGALFGGGGDFGVELLELFGVFFGLDERGFVLAGGLAGGDDGIPGGLEGGVVSGQHGADVFKPFFKSIS